VYVTQIFPELGAPDNFDGTLFMRSTAAFSAVALRLTEEATGEKLATLPVTLDGMYRPYINTVRITSTQRSTALLNFSIDVTDDDSDVATALSTSVTAIAIVDFGNGIGDYGAFTMNGTGVMGHPTGTITGSFQPRVTGIPSGFTAVMELWLYDSLGNVSNVVDVPVKYN